MASLREVKDHIASVRSTLKITSAMKLVASAKLRKAQQAAEGVRPYTEALAGMLASVLAEPTAKSKGQVCDPQGASSTCIAFPQAPAPASTLVIPSEAKESRVGIVAVASNSSLCGGFNINVIHKVQEVVREIRDGGGEVEVISVGRKMAEAMRKEGFAPEDHADLVGRNTFEKSAAFAQTLIDAFDSGRYGRILLIYNHFVSTASQKVQVEQYLPFASNVIPSEAKESDFILEPSREEILATLLPLVMRLRIHTVLLDSIAAEHAARTLAMQAASDNAEDLLAELTLEYNKGRQQKITSEILDLIGGAQQ
ncbi:MAG: ATP synthase F1 subunit gamma [Bacteroidales bacterium]|nr:ATP synthase F1 subunit gamma [Bacteroidales bacterium]